MSSEEEVQVEKRFKTYSESSYNEFDIFSKNEAEAIKAYRSIKIPETDEDPDLIWKVNAILANALEWVSTLLGKLENIKREIDYLFEMQSSKYYVELKHNIDKMTVEYARHLINIAGEDILRQQKEIEKKITTVQRLREALKDKSFVAQKLEDRIQASWYRSSKTIGQSDDINKQLGNYIPENIRRIQP